MTSLPDAAVNYRQTAERDKETKKLNSRRGTARHSMLVENLSTVAQIS